MNTKNPARAPANTGNNNSPVKAKQSEPQEQQPKAEQPIQKSPEAGKHGASNMPPRGK